MFLGQYFPPSMVTKLRNEITNFRQRPDESLFEAWECYKLSIDRCPNHNMLPVTQIYTFYNGLTLRHRDTINAAAGGTFMKRHLEKCYDLIENMIAHHNDWDTSAQRSESSSSITSSFDPEIVALKVEMAKINKNLMKVLQINKQVKAVTPSCETCGGPYSYNDCPATVGQTQNVYDEGAYQGGNSYQPQGNRNLLSYRSDNYLEPPGGTTKEEMLASLFSEAGVLHVNWISFGHCTSRRCVLDHVQETNSSKELVMVQTRLQLIKHRLTKPWVTKLWFINPLIPQPQVVTTIEFTNYMKANDVILKNMQTNMTPLTNSNLELKNMFGQFMKINTASSTGSGTLPSNTITNPKEDLKGITTQSGTAYQGPTIPTTSSSLPQVVERETEVTKDTVHPTNNGSTKDVQPTVIRVETPIPNYEPVIAPVVEPVVTPVSTPKPNQKPSIPYPSRLHDQKLHDKANDQKENFFQIFQDLNFNISFADALILMPKFGMTIKSLLTNKEKLFELARTPLDEHCSTVLLKKSPEKLRGPVWNKLSLPELTPTLNTLEVTDRSISRPIGVTEDVFVKVGKFHFQADFVVVDFDADLRVPLIHGRSFLKTGKALIDVHEGELTLRVGKEAITINLDQTSRYSANYNNMTTNRIDVIDMACEEYSQEVLGFSDVIEVDAFLALEDDPTSPEVDHSYYDMERDILLFESFLNDDPSLPPPTQGMYLPQILKELKICEAKNDKSLVNDPLKAEFKDLPPPLEYTFLEGDDKLLVIIAKDLSVEEKDALIKVLKSHKQAIA
nr:reverse transcriptase domain-containing protein [Tanacetum cinerariifolium]